MYAFQKVFLDGTTGVRVEEGNCIQGTFFIFDLILAIPCSLQTLLNVGNSVAVSDICKVCDKPASQSCVNCRTKYCSRVSLSREYELIEGMSEDRLDFGYT